MQFVNSLFGRIRDAINWWFGKIGSAGTVGKVGWGCGGLILLLFACSFVLGIVNNGMQAAGLAPTDTPRPTSTPVTPTSTPAPTNTPAPTDTPAPTNTPTIVPTATPDIGSESGAEVICHEFVKRNLRSPSTANFGGFLEDWETAEFLDEETLALIDITPESLGVPEFRIGGAWFVRGEVDAENAFGAMIRSNYSCLLDYDEGDENWYLLDISIESR